MQIEKRFAGKIILHCTKEANKEKALVEAILKAEMLVNDKAPFRAHFKVPIVDWKEAFRKLMSFTPFCKTPLECPTDYLDNKQQCIQNHDCTSCWNAWWEEHKND